MKETMSNNNNKCTECLACNKLINCKPGIGNPNADLAIFVDYPDRMGMQFLDWMLAKTCLRPSEVYIDFILKCGKTPATGKKKPREESIVICHDRHPRPGFGMSQIVLLGKMAIEASTDTKAAKDLYGLQDPATGFWCGYSPAYCAMNPSESYRVYRLLYKAAEAAGLTPGFDPSIEMFDFIQK